MLLSLISILALLATPLRVTACEDECPVGITNALVANYQRPVKCVTEKIGQKIINKLGLVAQDSTTLSPDSLLAPMMKAYRNTSYTDLNTNIFPGFFHGKCQVDGVDPVGCPNPDCPVVCGTPGSIVHFFSTFSQIGYNTTSDSLMSCVSPHSASYSALEKSVAAHLPKSEMGPGPQILRFRRSLVFANDEPSVSSIANRENFVSVLRSILEQIPMALEDCCGGLDRPLCLWERALKTLILSYP
ncbi:hypothetical protein B0H17DRAFT_1010882 [Mycena rosella]|uniref:Uncharacterized protein n=1 Tax=Mycena rosella TaxID=1033263 RepID=A0AAD7GJA5_MYCRO|nr:hypothetical protein B0H17DRAFT_1010882 [Mycena rosella]